MHADERSCVQISLWLSYYHCDEGATREPYTGAYIWRSAFRENRFIRLLSLSRPHHNTTSTTHPLPPDITCRTRYAVLLLLIGIYETNLSSVLRDSDLFTAAPLPPSQTPMARRR